MPRFFFDVEESGSTIRDREGIMLSDADAARRAAVEGARSLLCEAIRDGRLPLNNAIVITDEAGHVDRLTFVDSVAIE